MYNPSSFYVAVQALAPTLRKELMDNPKQIYVLDCLWLKKNALKQSIGLNFFMKAITSISPNLIASTKIAKYSCA